MIRREHITGLILAGGRGRRMGGADKGLLDYDGRPLIVRAIEVLRPQAGPLILSVNRHHQRYAAFGLPVFSDDDGEFAGPLAGIARALREATTPYLMVVPCDMPGLPGDLVSRLAEALAGSGAEAAVAQGDGRVQPLCILIAREVEESLRRFRAAGDAKVMRWVQGLRSVTVDFSDRPAAFRNINTTADLLPGHSGSAPPMPSPAPASDRTGGRQRR